MEGGQVGVIYGGAIGGSTHELVRDDHVFVCLWEQSTCI